MAQLDAEDIGADDDAAGGAGGGDGDAGGGRGGGGVRASLAPAELTFLQRYAALRHGHLDATTYSHMPDIAKYLAGEDGALMAASMAPSLKQHVFVRVADTVDDLPPDTAGGTVELVAGQHAIVQYRFIAPALRDGRAVL